jgi:hypothetical protein
MLPMSVITTSTLPDVERRVKDSVLHTLTEHLTMDRAQVAACLEEFGEDVRISSRVAIVVIARAQKAFGVKDIVDPRTLRPEQVTSIRSVTRLLIRKLRERCK